MASLHRDIPIDAHPDHVWAAVRDFGAVARLAPGFVIDARLDGDARIVTFANGNVARELLVDGNLAVARISKEVGYASVSHFIAEFRGRFGVTPRAYCDAHATGRELDLLRAASAPAARVPGPADSAKYFDEPASERLR